MMRKTIYNIVEKDERNNFRSISYDVMMLISIAVSLIPLMFRKTYPIFSFIETTTVVIFIIDYILRWTTADFKLKKGLKSFFLYPFTISAIIDMLSILPGLNIINKSFKLLKVTRLLKIVRILRFVRYSSHILMLLNVLKKEKYILLSVLVIAIAYILTTALIMFNAESHFNSFFDAVYWATTTLTTVGYGDTYPMTYLGRTISMISALFGVAIIALPSGIITASYLEELHNK
ncbi:MAG: ion transporter [Bacteroidetes bacterium]|nr:ion transporter [Bacteroidota bacterium]